MKLKNAAQTTASRGDRTPRRHDGRDRVRGVVEAVDEVEAERDDNDERRVRAVCHGSS